MTELDKYRFMGKVQKLHSCWFWIASKRNTGYGAFKIYGKVIDAHRVSYMIHKGDIPYGLLVCHSCDNRLCVNPDHLWLGTYRDNVRDMYRKRKLSSTA